MNSRNHNQSVKGDFAGAARAAEPGKLRAPRAIKALPEQASSADASAHEDWEPAPKQAAWALAPSFRPADHHVHSLVYGIDE
jgi:hypothetical protein